MAMTASHLPHLPPPLVTKKNLPSNHPICPPFLVCRVPILREERRRHSREESSQSRANRTEQGKTNGAAAIPRAPDDGHAETSTNTPQNQNDDAPLSPWKNSTAKRDIIKELNDDTSDIHLFIGSYGPGDWKQLKFEQLHLKYARRYQKSNYSYKENMKRLLLHFQNNTGFFGAKKDKEWYTSKNNVSDGYALLFSLYMDRIHSKTLMKMSDEEIWKSHALFQCYSLNDFALLHAADFKEFLARCKNRQETFHWRLKAFNILGGRFRHGTSVEHRMELHRMAVDAIVGVIQYDNENGHPPFDVC